MAPVPPPRRVWSRLFDVPLSVHAIPALDGIRGLAASLVFFVHFHSAFAGLVPQGSWLGTHPAFPTLFGYQGVNLFFALSGYLIYGGLVSKPTQFLPYLGRRVRRVYPTFLVVLAVYLVAGQFVGSRSKLPDEGQIQYILANALLLPGVFKIRPIITVAWSLSYEIFFYVGMAAGVAALHLRGWPRAARVLLIVAFVAAWSLGGPVVRDLVRNFIMFAPGLLLFEAIRGIKPEVRVPTGADVAIWGALLAVLVWVALSTPAHAGDGATEHAVLATLVLASAIVIAFFTALRSNGPVVRWLSWRPLRYIGVISYSFYLIHGLTINVCAFILNGLGVALPIGMTSYLLLAVAMYGACVIGGLTLFQTVERRFSL